MAFFGTKRTPTEEHFGIVPMDELLFHRDGKMTTVVRAVGEDEDEPSFEPMDHVRAALNATLLETFNRLPGTLPVKTEDQFADLTQEQKELLSLLGALERVQKLGLSGPGRQEPFQQRGEGLALQSLVQKSDLEMLRNAIRREDASAVSTIEAFFNKRIDRALNVLASRVSRKGRDPKRASEWTYFTDEEKRNLVAKAALENELIRGERTLTDKHWGKGLLAMAAAGALGSVGGWATLDPEGFESTTETIVDLTNAGVTIGLEQVSPEAAEYYKTHDFTPSADQIKVQGEAWFNEILPLLNVDQEEGTQN